GEGAATGTELDVGHGTIWVNGDIRNIAMQFIRLEAFLGAGLTDSGYIEDSAPWIVEIESQCRIYGENWREEWEREDWGNEYSTYQLHNMVVKPWNQMLVSMAGNSFLKLSSAIRELPESSGKEKVVDALERDVVSKCQSVKMKEYNEKKMKEFEAEIQKIVE
ncbi:MAG TPA: hypothetical protein DCE28_14430, partial [Halomonas sp.]